MISVACSPVLCGEFQTTSASCRALRGFTQTVPQQQKQYKAHGSWCTHGNNNTGGILFSSLAMVSFLWKVHFLEGLWFVSMVTKPRAFMHYGNYSCYGSCSISKEVGCKVGHVLILAHYFVSVKVFASCSVEALWRVGWKHFKADNQGYHACWFVFWVVFFFFRSIFSINRSQPVSSANTVPLL